MEIQLGERAAASAHTDTCTHAQLQEFVVRTLQKSRIEHATDRPGLDRRRYSSGIRCEHRRLNRPEKDKIVQK